MQGEFKENQIQVTTDDGVTNIFNILFTYENEQRGKKYVFYYPLDNEEEVLLSSYDDEGNLFEVEDDEEYDECEEVFNAFIEDPKIQEIK